MFEVYMTWVDQEGEVPLEGRVFETVNEAINKAQYILSKWYGVTKVAVYREGNLYWSNDSIYSLGNRTDIRDPQARRKLIGNYGVQLGDELIYVGSRTRCIAEIEDLDMDLDDDDVDLVNLETGRAESFLFVTRCSVCGATVTGGNCWNCDDPARY